MKIMHEFSLSITPATHLLSHKSTINLTLFHHKNNPSISSSSSSSILISRTGCAPNLHKPQFCYRIHKKKATLRFKSLPIKASRRESPYEVLGVSSTATATDIKKAYRKLALKYHPDVNKEPNAQQRFMRIKHAYNTLLNSESQRKYASGNHASDYSYSTAGGMKSGTEDEEFYGLGDFFKDLQEEYQNWEASATSQAKPKSLWEELAEIGEEFVEFLEKELNITDDDDDDDAQKGNSTTTARGSGSRASNEAGKASSIEENIDDIEAALAQLKKELGL